MEKALIISLIALGVITTFMILCCIKAGKEASGKSERNDDDVTF